MCRCETPERAYVQNLPGVTGHSPPHLGMYTEGAGIKEIWRAQLRFWEPLAQQGWDQGNFPHPESTRRLPWDYFGSWTCVPCS